MGGLRLRRLSGLSQVLASKFWIYDLNLDLTSKLLLLISGTLRWSWALNGQNGYLKKESHVVYVGMEAGRQEGSWLC